jgi:putative SOS response-associated peptidase YedK
MREQIVGELARLSEIHQQNLRFAVLIARTEEAIDRFGCSLGHESNIVCRVNARVETLVTGKFFNQLWPNGRVLAPANGWFEWVKDPADSKKKQPYFITLKE